MGEGEGRSGVVNFFFIGQTVKCMDFYKSKQGNFLYGGLWFLGRPKGRDYRSSTRFFNRNLCFVCKKVALDYGRYLFLYALIDNLPCIIDNVYIPPPYISEAIECFIQIWMGKQNVLA